MKAREVRETEQQLVSSRSCNMAEFTQFIRERSTVHDILRNHYAATITDTNENQYALYRKLKLSAKSNCDRIDRELISKLQERFPDVTYIMGNWSPPMARFHELTRSLGFSRLLRKYGFNVLFINEYKTSRICPKCH